MKKHLYLILTLCLFRMTLVYATTSITIYNQNFAVIRETIKLKFSKGINQVKFTDITSHLEPSSIILRDPLGKYSIKVLEQNYRADPISENLLLSIYEGQTIDFLVLKGEQEEELKKGKIIRSGYGVQKSQDEQPIIEMDGKLRFSLPGIPLFPALTDDTILKPTLHWILETNQSGEKEVELAYVTGNMNWNADYNVILPEKGNLMNIVGWVTIDNHSGKTFENTKIKLMAGDVNKIKPYPGNEPVPTYSIPAKEGRPNISERTFDEYHLYTIQRQTTLRDKETKQVEFLKASGIKSQQIYVYSGAKFDYDSYRYQNQEYIRDDKYYGTLSNPKVWVMREFKNSEDNNLGIPLPRGRLRFYRQNTDGQLEFTGENIIDHTPKDETIRIYTGNAFDLVGERQRKDFEIDTARNFINEEFKIKLRNHKKEPVEIRVVEYLYRWNNWEIVQKSDDYIKTDDQTIEFRINLKPDEEKIISYRVHYTW